MDSCNHDRDAAAPIGSKLSRANRQYFNREPGGVHSDRECRQRDGLDSVGNVPIQVMPPTRAQEKRDELRAGHN